MSQVHQFPDRMYFVSEDRERMKTSNYIAYAKSNVKLFLDGVRRIDGFPVLAFFSFEDLFLQQNKQTILGCLSNLHLFATKPNDDMLDDDEEMPEDAIVEEVMASTSGVVKRPAFDPLRRRELIESVQTTAPQSFVPSSYESEGSPTTIASKQPLTQEPFSRAVISVFALPFVTLFLIILTLWRLYLEYNRKGTNKHASE